ncbi:MAG TPA: tRNA uridine-5-carboxymethylaminomethyl(34) synthesis GTPase MnmE [Rhodocyclaceae bacterium]
MARTDPANRDTIAAVATPPGRGGVGIVRISGAGLDRFAAALIGAQLAPRLATRCHFRDAAGETIDDGLAIAFTAPNSFTGEDVLELHGHGSPVAIAQLLARCHQLGARPARPGEFSERAFLNGKLDLVQAEAIADLIDASTAAAARSAIRSLSGAFSEAIAAVAHELVRLRMLTEATLDFSDEEIDALSPDAAQRAVEQIEVNLTALRRDADRGKLLRDGLSVVLIGRPNVGKSSLMNHLAGDEIAIVSEYEGTTRDSLKRTVQLRGIPVHVVDTAGLRDTDDPVEQIGIARTWREISKADVALVIADARTGVQPEDRALIDRLPPGLQVLTVLNKSDLAKTAHSTEAAALAVSARTGEGLPALEERLLAIAHWHPGEATFIARERHLDALRRCADHLSDARGSASQLELFAEELRLAHRALQEITGEYSTEDLLGEIFSGFCIGK